MKKTVRRWAQAAVVVALAAMLSGCWDQLPYTSRACVLAIVIRRLAPQRWAWTFVFPNPNVTVSSISQIAPANQLYSVTVVAPTMAQAFERAQAKLARDLYLGQIELVIWSSAIRSQSLWHFLCAYNRQGMTPKTVFTLVEPNPLATQVPVTPQETIPSLYLTKYFDCHSCQTIFLSRQMWQVWDNFLTPGISAVVPYAHRAQAVNQIAVYARGDHPPVIFSRDETKGWAYLTGRVEHDMIGYNTPDGPITVTDIHEMVKTQVALVHHGAVVHTTVDLVGNLDQWPSAATVTAPELNQVSRRVERIVLGWCLEALRRADQTHTDPFGYNRMLVFRHREWINVMHPGQWEWVPIWAHVTVVLHIRRTGVSG